MTDTVANYLPQFLPRAVVQAVVVADDNPTVPYWTWSSGPGYDRSGDQYEYASLRNVNGEQWAFSDAFGNPDKHEWFPMEAVVDLVTRNGTTTDFAVPGTVQGCSYLPRDLPDSGKILIRQWFWLWSAKPENGGVRVRKGFWQGDFTFGNSRPNPGFQGDGDKTRKVAELREVWWDEAAGWVRGHPQTAGELPWNGDTPNPLVVVPEQLDCIGYNVGHLWVGHDGTSPVHLRSIEYATDTPTLPKVTMPDDAALDRNTAALDRNTVAVEALTAKLSATPAPTPTPPSPTPTPPTPTPIPPTPTPTPPSGGSTLGWPYPAALSFKYAALAETLEFDFGPVGQMLHPVGKVQFAGGPNTWHSSIMDMAGNVVAVGPDSATPWIPFDTDGRSSGNVTLAIGQSYKARYVRITSEPNPIEPRCDLYI